MLMHTHTHIVLAIIAQKWWIYNGAVNYVAWLYGVGFNFFFFHFIHSLCVFWCSFMRHIRYLRSVWIRLYFCFSPIYFFTASNNKPMLAVVFQAFQLWLSKKKCVLNCRRLWSSSLSNDVSLVFICILGYFCVRAARLFYYFTLILADA